MKRAISYPARNIASAKRNDFLFRVSKTSSVLSRSRHSSLGSEYLHESIIPTDHFQDSLVRLAVPKLEKTCERYLASQRVLLSPEEYTATEAITQEFLKTEGKKWHEELVKFDKANKHTSYVTDFWFDMYFKDRRPVSFNHNPFLSYSPIPGSGTNSPLVKATNTIISSMKFMKTLRANVLEPEVFHLDPRKSDTLQFKRFVRRLPKSVCSYGAYWYQAYPLDMSQFPSLFNSTRIPRKDKDELYKDETARHMLVMRNGHLYVFDAIDASGSIVEPEVIMANLQSILEDKSPQPKHSLGFLTTLPRDRWAEAREDLINTGNGDTMTLIDSALFCLCLDEGHPSTDAELAKTFLHGDGANRWFDKSFSVLMTDKGDTAINFEHSWGDGVAVLRYFNEVWKDTIENPAVTPMAIPRTSSAQVKKLEFSFSDTVRSTIEAAESEFKAKASSLDLQSIETSKLGKHLAKTKKVSPDSIMQFVIQLAYWQQSSGQVAATYESCSTSAFKHGRTETVRPATAETKAACELFSRESGANREDCVRALQACSATHGQLTKNAAMGQGFDRHLMAMKLLAQQSNELPSFYKDPSYAKINHIILSTSTLNSPAFSGGGFGPVVPDGYGVGYSIQDDRCGYLVTAYPSKDLGNFMQCLSDSVDKVAKVLS